MQGDFAPATRLEVQKALGNLASGRSPEPDGLPADASERPPPVLPFPQAFLYAVYYAGNFLGALRRKRGFLLNKLGKDPRIPMRRRPLPLLNTAMGIPESVAYCRLLRRVGAGLHPQEFAYRRGRGVKHHLVSLLDMVHRPLLRVPFAYEFPSTWKTLAMRFLTMVW